MCTCNLESYATATFVSCSTAVGLGKMVEKAKSLPPNTRSFLRKVSNHFFQASKLLSWCRLSPLPALEHLTRSRCVSTSFSTLNTLRIENSWYVLIFLSVPSDREGIDIMDEYGDEHGRSVAAGRQSLGQVALTRIALPIPSKFRSVSSDATHSITSCIETVLLLPPYMYEIMKKTNVMPKGKYPKLAAELADPVITVILIMCLWGAMPSAVALFPQTGTISANSVEEEFRSREDRHGQPVSHFIYNKGI
ncbi:hypothetical protein PsorP6_008032 [Peronosclerospora sorghi]|uniref:Uncharacterized protein n=1 Tax=Peronosclerospora sorghi TaxID=230839 RepID=A0ACC0W7V2_9STRA|nr:hypothetical protein PsorP6_008032 [Peronosclerospora sorghi]